jgi:L-fuconolactonase
LQRHPRFKGVRHPVHDESDERWLLRPDVIAGLEELQRRDIPYDLLLRSHHLPLIPQLVEKVPQLRMVIDHIAKPDIRNRMWEPWASDLERLAAFPQIYVKISGMITEADPANWTASDLTPYVQHVLKRFGVERCMYGSDWPVCFLASSAWKQVLAAFTQAHGPIAKESRVKMTGKTAAKFYGLDVPEHPVTL